MFGWYSEKVAKEKKLIYLYKDKEGIKTMCTAVTTNKVPPYKEETYFGSDAIYVGELKEYVANIVYNENGEFIVTDKTH